MRCWRQISANLADGEAAETEQWYFREGTAPLAVHLADRLGEALSLNAPVTRIEQDADGVTVTAAPGPYRARHAIIAVPPQFYGDIGLSALLPAKRRTVAAGWVRGEAVKTMLVFERPWWRDAGMSGLSQTMGDLFNSTMDGSPADGSLGILVLFSTGTSGRLLGRMAEEGARIAAAKAHLEALAGAAIPSAIGGRSIDWSGDPLARGGYASRRGIGGWLAAPEMFAPLGRIHFAGTETATEWRSFMEGALQSAERAVSELL